MTSEPSDETAPTPIIILTGFLGAGKTSVLRALLRRAEFRRSALLINELGELGIDQLLVDGLPQPPVLLPGGCICCALSGDANHALRDLYERRLEGLIPAFRQVFIETTGLANPGPVIQQLLTDAWLSQRYRLHAVVAVVDAAHFVDQVSSSPEAALQVALADRIIVSKADLASQQQRLATETRVATLNPDAPCRAARQGDVPTGFVLDPLPHSIRLSRLGAGPQAISHSSGISTTSFEYGAALPWSAATDAFDSVFAKFGHRLLRAKAVLRIAGAPHPVLIQGVQGVFYPPEFLRGRRSVDADSRVVLITRGVDARIVADELLRGIATHSLPPVGEREHA